MNTDTHQNRRHNILRLISLIVIVLTVIFLEVSTGKQAADEAMANIVIETKEWPLQVFEAPRFFKIPPKLPGKTRILYVSNSHARTGGLVSSHLQNFLDAMEPGKYEVLDMAEAGIFAPDILQRTLLALDFDVDVVVLGVSYISFSDLMPLSRQSHSARSFFKPGIFEKLPVGFWLRNYDINLYLNTLFSEVLDLYKWRNRIRKLWEQPLARKINSISSQHQPICFLEIDERRTWKFPAGYDMGLFQWKLYSAGRSKQMADLKALVNIIRQSGKPFILINLPIDWNKSPDKHDETDFASFRATLAELADKSGEFEDQQDIFPKEFSTYDAMHPTWYGARLHALKLLFRLHGMGIVKTDQQTITQKYLESDSPLSKEYRDNLNGEYPVLKILGFRRYDIFEPDNARMLLRRLATFPVGHKKDIETLFDLSLRLRYWQNADFPNPPAGLSGERVSWRYAVDEEIKRARERAFFFQSQLVTLQTERVKKYPLPEITANYSEEASVAKLGEGHSFIAKRYKFQDTMVDYVLTPEGNPFLVRVIDKGKTFSRADILGDGSMLLLIPSGGLYVPHWVISPEIESDWGI